MEQWNSLLIPFEKRLSVDVGNAHALVLDQHNKLPLHERAFGRPILKARNRITEGIKDFYHFDYKEIPTRLQYMEWVESMSRGASANCKIAGQMIDALNRHYLPRMYRDLKREDPEHPTALVGRFAQVAFELHLLHGNDPRQHFLKILGEDITREEFHDVIRPRAAQYASDVLEAYVRTDRFRKVGLSAEFENEADPFNSILRDMGNYPATVLLNAMELAGEDIGHQDINQQLHDAVKSFRVLVPA